MSGRLLPFVGVPIKPFGVAKQRLVQRLDARARSRLGRAIAAHTLEVICTAGADVVVITADAGVRDWAAERQVRSIQDGPGGGLDAAAAALQDAAARVGRPWLVMHADLPLLAPSDVAALVEPLAAGESVIAPSHDGGTSALGSCHSLVFSYGVASFHRHLRRLNAARVISRPGLAYDLDTVADLDDLMRHPGSDRIRAILGAIDSTP